MTIRRAACRCGALTATCTGVPVRISVCHCLDCQRRSGSAFAAQVRFADADVAIRGAFTSWRTSGDSGRWGEFSFCPTCGTQLFYRIEYFPDLVAIPLGAFDDPHAFTPAHSVWESRRHDWVALTGDLHHHD